MTRESRLWLGGAGGIAVVVAAVVLIFGYNSPPGFPDLREQDGVTVEGTVAYMDYGREDCVRILDVATGGTDELYCESWVWIEGWDADGNLRVNAGNGYEQTWVLDPETGEVLGVGEGRDALPPDEGGPPPADDERLRSRSTEGRATLLLGSGDDQVTVIDVEAPRNYAFHSYGITADGEYIWVSDSEDRLLLVALDGSRGPWLVAEEIADPYWK